jgi:hypothetical protein
MSLGSVTLDAVTARFEDLSTPDSFAFAFVCDLCGRRFATEPERFAHPGFVPPLAPGLRALLWDNQHREAFYRANREALFAFSLCAGCGRRVCDRCFCPSSGPGGDACRQCADNQ